MNIFSERASWRPAIFLALADGATQRASWLEKRGKGGLGDVDKKIQ
ncbi:MAG: hypothetical protein Q7U59_00055 [Lutibacter sp.]|nr:hypothetical protein [Lutibacter sp.]